MKCFLQEESAICELENGLDWRKGIHLKNFYYVIKFLETIEIKSLLHLLTLPREWCHDDAKTSTFNINNRLFK